MVRVLERLGHTVEFPVAQTCCGQMHYNTGYHGEAVPLVRRFVEMFREAGVVCVPSASCVAMMREHYQLIAERENDAAFLAEVRALLPRVFEFSELLVHRLGVEDVGARFTHSVTYHPSCHSLRMLKVADAPVRLLRAGGARAAVCPPTAESGTVLRVWRNLCREECRMSPPRMLAEKQWRGGEDGGGGGGRARQFLPDANIRRAASRGIAGAHHAPRGDSGLNRRNDGRNVHCYRRFGGCFIRSRSMSVRVGKTKQAPAFPVAAKTALKNEQLRANVHRATDTIRTKRAMRVEETPDWQELLCATRQAPSRRIRWRIWTTT